MKTHTQTTKKAAAPETPPFHKQVRTLFGLDEEQSQAQHSPHPLEGRGYRWEGASLVKYENGQGMIATREFIVASVNNAEALAEALRAWEYAKNEGGISMVDWFEVAWKKTQAALAQWEQSDQSETREAGQ